MARETWFEANRLIWNDRVPIHRASDFYGVAAFKAGAEVLHDFELAEVGDVTSQRLVHLQCHFGMDTLAWARHGADVTGIDLSESGITAARDLAQELAIPARFETANVYDAADVLGETYDVVYTGRGSLNWLPDLAGWAAVVDRLLRPGGILYLNELHPLPGMMAADSLQPELDYFSRAEGYELNAAGSYTETGETTAHSRSFQWIHGTSEVITALLGVGLEIELFREFDFTVFARFPFLECEEDGLRRIYRMPEGMPRLPLLYSVRARKPHLR